MKEMSKQNIIRIATWFMIIVFGLIMVNNTVYTHSHIKDDGTLVIHAHPFDKSNDSAPLKKHQHSKAEYLFIASVNSLFLIYFFFLSILIVFVKQSVFSITIFRYLFYWQLFIKGRSPPVL